MTPPPATPPSGFNPSHDTDAMPRVGGNPSLWPVVAGLLGASALGVIVFLQLNGNRARLEEARLTDKAQNAAPLSTAGVPPAPDVSMLASPTPTPVIEPEPLLPPPPPPVNLAPVAAMPAGPSQADIDHYRAPALVIDLGQYTAPEQVKQQVVPGQPLDPRNITGAMSGAVQPKGPTDANGKTNPDDAFAQRFGVGESSKPATAKHMGDLSLTIVEGAVIPAVLETALNSDLPGYARAVVSRDVRGFDGKAVLVPRGTRLIGQYKSGVAQGQSRAFVIWTRLIRPDGATVELSSPATDALGRGGLAGDVDTHFLQRFGGAVLLSLIDIGVASATSGASTAIIVAGARTGDTATASIAKDQSIAPTVKVPQGSPVRVFVSQDLDFTAVGAAKPAQ